jgi:hypothetical protein
MKPFDLESLLALAAAVAHEDGAALEARRQRALGG